MNQPNLSVMAPKTIAVAETPELMTLVKRYAWLLLGGAVVGAAVSTGYYAYALKYQAEYTAHIPFKVLPTPMPIGGNDSIASVLMTSDDTSQIINRQKFLFEQEPFLDRILNSDEFHPQERGGETPWLTENKIDRMRGIKRDLQVAPRVNAAAFEITMTTHIAAEAQSLVQAAAKEFILSLREESSQRNTAYLEGMQKAVKIAEAAYQNKADALADYARRQQIDVLKAGFEIQKNALQSLNDQFTKADAEAASANGMLQTFQERKKRLRETGIIAPTTGAPDTTLPATSVAGMSDLEISDILLSLEMKQYIEQDFTLRTLLSTKMSWQQEMAAELSKTAQNVTAANKARIMEIQARLDEIDAQIEKTRNKLKLDAMERMEKMLSDEFNSKRGLADYIGTIRKTKEDLVNELGQRLLAWDQRVTELKEQSDLLNKMHNQYALAEANKFTDDTRIQQMIGVPAVPDKPSWPKWYMFIPLGTIAGLGLSAMLAYLLLLTDTRVRTPRDISRTLQLPVLGFVPDEGDDRILSGDVETAILNSPASMVAESFRQIRSQVSAQTAHNPVNTLVVASIAPGGGATTVAINLAAGMALNDLRVLLVDANFYRPSFGRIFKGIPAEGLTNALASIAALDAAIAPHPDLPRLHLLGVGSALSGASAELFEGKAFRELLENLKTRYDMIIFDGAPLNLVADSLSLASRVDGIVSVVRAGEVSRGTVARVRDQLRNIHANLLGFVLNAAQISNTGYFKENYKSFYRYAGKAKRK